MIEQSIKRDLSNWKSIVSKYQKPDNKKAILQILTSFMPFLALWVLMYFTYSYSKALTLGLAVINAFFLVRIFIIQHDCGHQSYFGSRVWNNITGVISSYFSTIPFHYWARTHSYHHAHTGMLEHRDIGDIDFLTVTEFEKRSKWQRFWYRVFRNPFVLFVIVPIFYFVVSLRLPLINLKVIRNMNYKQLINNVGLIIAYCTLGYFLGWERFFFIQLSILGIFMIIAFWFFYIQHQHEHAYFSWKDNWDFLLASIRGATFYKLPALFNWLTGNIGYHHIHHLNSLIPNYNLVRCSKENPILNKYVNTINFKESLKLINNKLWDEKQNRMISFREYYRTAAV
ncbi:MAG: fatty acid desaturase [Saprospiraceae bacterium]|nr:fatty acid desaturase [Saprospiraceae bacterium]